jgi:pyruvate/2-oxoglutarate dehydrogenase complex dihydrolipoamide acyltransferase (E2) component
MNDMVKVPELGEGVDEATIAKLYISKGDSIEEETEVAELETDKASLDMPAQVSGEVEEILVENGDRVSPGDEMIRLKSHSSRKDEKTRIEEGKGEKKEQEKEEKEDSQKTSTDKNNYSKSEKDRESYEAKYKDDKKLPHDRDETSPSGDSEKVDSKSDSSNQDEYKDSKSKGKSSFKKEDENTNNSAEQAKKGEYKSKGKKQSEIDKENESKESKAKDKKFKTKIDDESVQSDDQEVKKGDTELESPRIVVKDSQNKSIDSVDSSNKKDENYWQQEMAKMTQKSWREIPHVTNFITCNSKALTGFLKKNKKREFGLTSILVKLTSLALKDHPKLNARYEDQELEKQSEHNFSIAIEREKRLAMMTVKNIEEKNVKKIAKDIKRLAKKVEANNVDHSSINGGTFGITNIGRTGVRSFTPIIYPPQVAILGIGSIENDQLELSLSFDHRGLTGMDAARFLSRLKELIESPFNILR